MNNVNIDYFNVYSYKRTYKHNFTLVRDWCSVRYRTYILIFLHMERWRTLLDGKYSGLKVDFLAERLRIAFLRSVMISLLLIVMHCEV